MMQVPLPYAHMQAASSTTFLDRLEVDIRKREVNRAESARRWVRRIGKGMASAGLTGKAV